MNHNLQWDLVRGLVDAARKQHERKLRMIRLRADLANGNLADLECIMETLPRSLGHGHPHQRMLCMKALRELRQRELSKATKYVDREMAQQEIFIEIDSLLATLDRKRKNLSDDNGDAVIGPF